MIKAWVSTDFSVYADTDFCVNKKLDAVDDKLTCWKDKNIWEFTVAHIDLLPQYTYLEPIHAGNNINYPESNLHYINTHGPPWDSPKNNFLDTYVGVTLLLC